MDNRSNVCSIQTVEHPSPGGAFGRCSIALFRFSAMIFVAGEHLFGVVGRNLVPQLTCGRIHLSNIHSVGDDTGAATGETLKRGPFL